jgi:hypothetical protein
VCLHHTAWARRMCICLHMLLQQLLPTLDLHQQAHPCCCCCCCCCCLLLSLVVPPQEAVRMDHLEVVRLMEQSGGKVWEDGNVSVGRGEGAQQQHTSSSRGSGNGDSRRCCSSWSSSSVTRAALQCADCAGAQRQQPYSSSQGIFGWDMPADLCVLLSCLACPSCSLWRWSPAS